jgi:hypothetical protein
MTCCVVSSCRRTYILSVQSVTIGIYMYGMMETMVSNHSHEDTP